MKKFSDNRNKIGLWRKYPPVCHGTSRCKINLVFPSGRQAITAALTVGGFGRSSLIAVPEWSSHCVISAVSRVATPAPLPEVINYGLKVDGVLLYEQWGWPLPDNAREKIAERFKNNLIILDRVDSADLDNKKKIKFYPENNEFEIISLSKLIGTAGGGFLKLNGKYKKFKPDNSDFFLQKKLRGIRSDKKILNFYKNEIKFLHPDLEAWLENNDLFRAIGQEALSRENNLKIILNNKLSQDWKKWMVSAVASGSRPSLAPFFPGAPVSQLKKIKQIIEKKFGVESEIYHFNFSGDPLKPDHKICLAFPINGLVKNTEAILKEINKMYV
ncbi:MAG: hypothetical protein Q8O93_03485 [bacterium]|nr:hypothetical protein [bacterium]